MNVTDIVMWFSGGEEQYHRLMWCLGNDPAMISIVVFLSLTVGFAYLVIVSKWWKLIRSRRMPDSRSRKSLRDLCFIFVLCACSSYFFLPLKLVWPAWRLWAVFVSLLAFFSWKYALYSTLSSVYFDVQSAELARDSLKRMADLSDNEARLEINKLKELIDCHD